MDKDSSKGLAQQALFAGEAWFDPIEAGLRGRIRGLSGRRSAARPVSRGHACPCGGGQRTTAVARPGLR